MNPACDIKMKDPANTILHVQSAFVNDKTNYDKR